MDQNEAYERFRRDFPHIPEEAIRGMLEFLREMEKVAVELEKRKQGDGA